LHGLHVRIIMVTMATASVSELKANLSRYLREIRRGGEIEVLDRGTPVARLVPPAANDDAGIRERLIAKGMVRPGNGRAAAILETPPLALRTSLLEALEDERADRL
jgi:prevent-host-death family protein